VETNVDAPEQPPDRRLLLAQISGVVVFGGVLWGLWFEYLEARALNQSFLGNDLFSDLSFVLTFMTFPVIGYVIATRRPDNTIGWLLLGIGVFFGVTAVADSYAGYAINSGADPDGGALAAALNGPSWVPIVVLPATFLPLLFPDGHLPSRRWRWFACFMAVSFSVIVLLILFSPGDMADSGYPGVRNPIGIEALRPILEPALVVIATIPIGIAGSLLGLILRFRRSTGIERLQLRWLVTAVAIVASLYIAALFLAWGREWVLLQNIAIMSFALIPIAMGLSILRYRLFDLDLVINRAVLFGALALFVTLVYLAIVIGVGAIVGARSSPLLSAAAAATVALAFQPVRRRAQRLVDRLVYGKRATPYEVLSEFSERVGHVYASDDLLPRMAQALGEGTGAARADVWVRSGDQLRVEASWPIDAIAPASRPASSADPAVSTTTMFEPVMHRGDLLGALSIEKRPGDALRSAEQRLVTDLAAQAGLVLRNAALTDDLLATIEELRRSRQRLVAAQDEERRKLERNLHDGAQQRIVALTVQLGLLERLVERDPAKAKEIASHLQGDATEALEELRDLARGIYPPLLADRGLVAALESQARKSIVPVQIVATVARVSDSRFHDSASRATMVFPRWRTRRRIRVDVGLRRPIGAMIGSQGKLQPVE
jgi:signal transduction histidine kinase